MKPIYCTYCWRRHFAESVADWIKTNQIGDGRDPDRYFLSKADYLVYVRQYQAAGQHPQARPAAVQLPLFEGAI